MKDLSLLKKPTDKGILDEEPKEKQEEAKPQRTQKKSKPSGRPPLNKEEKRTELVKIYLTKTEREKLLKKIEATVQGYQIPESQFLRKLLVDNDLI
jgi:hypothetical protein